jgi:hypothetical protein
MRPSGFHLDFATTMFLLSKVVSLASNLQHGGPIPCIYVLQWQGGPVIPPVIGFYDSQGYGGGNLTSDTRDPVMWPFYRMKLRLPGGLTSLLSNGCRGSFPGLTQSGLEPDHLPPFNGEVKNSGAIPPLLHIFAWLSGSLIFFNWLNSIFTIYSQ